MIRSRAHHPDLIRFHGTRDPPPFSRRIRRIWYASVAVPGAAGCATRKWQLRGWHGQTRLTVVVPRAPLAQEDTLKLRLGVPPTGLGPASPQFCRTPDAQHATSLFCGCPRPRGAGSRGRSRRPCRRRSRAYSSEPPCAIRSSPGRGRSPWRDALEPCRRGPAGAGTPG